MSRLSHISSYLKGSLEVKKIKLPKVPDLNIIPWDFPGGAVVKNPPANGGDMGSSPGLGRSHMLLEQLSPCATTTEPAL